MVLIPTRAKVTDPSKLHILAFVKDTSIRSLRDLNETHIDLLEDICDKGTKFIKYAHNIDSNKLRVYVHYPPTTWLLHVHFNLIENTNISSSVEYSYSVYDIINNLKIKGNYYQTISMHCLTNDYNSAE